MLNVEVTRGASHRGDKSPERQITRSTNGLVGGLPSTVHSQPSTVNGLGGSRRLTVDGAPTPWEEDQIAKSTNHQIDKWPDRQMA